MGQLGGGYDTSQGTSESSVWDKQSPFLENLFGMGGQLAGGFQPDQGLADSTRAAHQQQLQPMGNPYMSSFTNQFQDQLGQLNRGAGGQAQLSGGYGGGREGVARHLNTQAVGDQMGRFMGNQYQGDMQRQADAIGMGGQVMGASGLGQQWANLGRFQGILGAPHNEQYQQDTSKGYQGNLGMGK